MPTLSGRRRPLTLEEQVNIEAGEDSLSDSDDLDMLPRKRIATSSKGQDVSFDEYINSIQDAQDVVEITSDDDPGLTSGAIKKSKPRTKGEKITFDDDESSDEAYKTFQKRKTVKRKKEASDRAAVKKRSTKSSMVGVRKKTLLDKKSGKERAWGEPSDDEALMETSLPDYLQQRRSSWDQKQNAPGDDSLLLPPTYDDVEFSDDERLEDLAERPTVTESMPPINSFEDIELKFSGGLIPAPVAQFLKPYQIDGVQFLHQAFVYQKGVILGDDMGLGKTVQIVAFLTVAFGKTGDERDKKRMRKIRRLGDKQWYPRALLIMPGSLMRNWENELAKWGWWHVYVCHGTKSKREEALHAATSGRLEVMITTYDTYRTYASEINAIRWDCVVADECHKIKEKTSAITKQMNDVNALCRIGLTGTAIQNKYEELWTLLNWTNPGTFGPISSWKQMICIPLKLGQSHDATLAQLAKARETATKLTTNVLPPFFLRRTKALIAHQLPKKSDQVVFCPMTERQTEAYNNFCDSELIRCIRESSEPCDCGSGKKMGWCCYTEVDGMKWQHAVFPALVMFQKIANHLALLLPSTDNGDQHDKDVEKLKAAMPDSWLRLYKNKDSILNLANPNFCGKWRILRKLLRLWHANCDKVLVFSYSVRLLKMLDLLFKTTTSYSVSYLSGETPYAERQETVDDFNSNANQFVFLISTKAGGLGLNITSANKVVIVDPNWNPSYDLQAQDRAYRIGQTRDVEVFRLISSGTIEEIVYARQVYKQQQANIGYNASVERRYFKGVQDQKDLKGEIFGLGNLFAPASENIKLRDIFNKTNIAESRADVEIVGLDLEASQALDDLAGDDDPLLAPDDSKKAVAAMSQLAQEIIDEPASRRNRAKEKTNGRDPVQAILASVGVEYTHNNAEVIGTSKVEQRISSRARKVDPDGERERAFAPSQGDSVTAMPGLDGEDDGGDRQSKAKILWKPDEEVRKRQFCSMARSFGYEDVGEFALVVEGWTQEERRRGLEVFYGKVARVYTPSTLHFWSHTAAWTEMMNLAFFIAHSSTKTMPGEVARFQTETQFINELGSQEGTFIAVLAFDQPDGEPYDGIIGTAAAKRYAPPTGALPPKSQQGETFSRSTESFATFEGAELWELRHMGIRPDLQGRGLAGYLMKFCEEEVQRLFDARKAKGEVVDGMGLVMLLTTLKEINETFYAKRGWKWDEEKKFGKGWMGSEAGFSVAHMSKRLVQ
nr:hypothetical protein B0A51_12774 [Rachicladosporium sp. CCFEE 5018]